MKPQSSADLLSGPREPEFILLCGKDGVGKSCAVVSLAWYVEQTEPAAKVYVIDTEFKFPAALRSFGADAPRNITYYGCATMETVIEALDAILKIAKPGDWIAVESMAQIWELAQDLGYQETTGMTKGSYMGKRRSVKGSKPPATPQPETLWNVTKNAHDIEFVNRLKQLRNINVIMTTLVKPTKDGNFLKENKDRKAFRVETGLDANLAGAPLLPSVIHTLSVFDMVDGEISCRVLRDDLSQLDVTRVEFDVEDRKSWASTFWSTCR